MSERIRFKSLEDARRYLTANPSAIPPAAMVHCAQSLEYNVAGFPQPKGALFHATIGKIVAAIFLARGEMKHSLDAAIPGAPPESAPDAKAALARLLGAIDRFRQAGEIRAHFAFGLLPKEKADRLQAFHIADHVSGRR